MEPVQELSVALLDGGLQAAGTELVFERPEIAFEVRRV
jgi:hypothetical protein